MSCVASSDLAHNTTNRFTFESAPDQSPVWSPDGRRLVWSSQRASGYTLYQKASDFSGEDSALPLPPSAAPIYPEDWSRDGRFLLYSANGIADSDLWVLPLQGDSKPVQFLGTRSNESQGRFSPDSRYVAYMSNQSGTGEVYVRSISADGKAGGQQMISQGGGQQPLWRRDGKELFYVARDSKVMAVPVSTAPTFQRAGAPVELFTAPIYYRGGLFHIWEVTPDGQKFLMVTVQTEVASEPITTVLNWTGLLRK